MDEQYACSEPIDTASNKSAAKAQHDPPSMKLSQRCDSDDTNDYKAQKRHHESKITESPTKYTRSDYKNTESSWPKSNTPGCTDAQHGSSRNEGNSLPPKRQRRTSITTLSCRLSIDTTSELSDEAFSDTHDFETAFLNDPSGEWSQVQRLWASTNDGNTTDLVAGYVESNDGHLTRGDFARLQTNQMLTDEVVREIANRITVASDTLAFIPSMILEKKLPIACKWTGPKYNTTDMATTCGPTN